ncbi:MAG: thioredoxin domain-containing protein [Anaerolineaceae bacterium]|nr:thioredoxin domain-containing protein [Anaerolineaceae bacterium]
MSKREEMKAKRIKAQRTQNFVTIAIIAVAAILIIGIIVYPYLKPVGTIVVPTPVNYPQPDKNNLGNPNAPVKVEAFEDFQCPFCKAYTQGTEPLVITNYVSTGKVYYTFTPFSFLDDQAGNSAQESKTAAAAAYCAMDQGKFWQYHDMIYANQTGENVGDFTQRRLVAFAGKLGLDTNTFQTCLSSGKYTQQVLNDKAFASSKGVNATPYFLVNGKLVDSSGLIQAINDAIGAAK